MGGCYMGGSPHIHTEFLIMKLSKEPILVFFYGCRYIQGFPPDKIIAGCCVFIAGDMTISGIIFSYFDIFLTAYWKLKPVHQELKPVGTASSKGLGKTLISETGIFTRFHFYCIWYCHMSYSVSCIKLYISNYYASSEHMFKAKAALPY